MKVLFLDIDGVVNCATTVQRHEGFIGIDPYMAFLVGKIQLDTDCKVVLSSSWRHSESGEAEVRKAVVDFIDTTPRMPGIRGEEIKAWLDAHPDVERYAIVDDGSDMLDGQMPSFFKTEWKIGITKEIAEAITLYLNGYPRVLKAV